MASMKETSSAARGTTIVEEFPRDNSSMDVKTPHGKKLGGGRDNLAHSLSGASAVMTGSSK